MFIKADVKFDSVGTEKIMSDNLGDRMKMYEGIEHGHILMPHLPIYARLDGKCFSKIYDCYK